MQKITKLTGIDNKLGRRSRTGSTITMGVDDMIALEAQQYLMTLEKGEEPTGRIKRIELVIYDESDMGELERLETLQAENKKLKALIESIDQPITQAVEQLEEVTGDIEEDESTDCQANEKENLPPNQLDLKMDGDE